MSQNHESPPKKKGSPMYVIKRDGRREVVLFDKITSRIKALCFQLDEEFVDPVMIAQKVVLGVYRGVTTSELDILAGEIACNLTSIHPDYGILAARIVVSNLQKSTEKLFSDVIEKLYYYIHPQTKKPSPMVSKTTYQFVMKHKDILNARIIHSRDFDYDYFGFKTLERSYLLKMDGKCVERPQHMLMRVAVGIHGDEKNEDDADCMDRVNDVIKTYDLMSQGFYTHASPTLFNAGTQNPQLSSCFLMQMEDDSIEGIYNTLKECALISKGAGGIGLAMHHIRATGSYISGTNGTSNGLIPMLGVFDRSARYVDQCFHSDTGVYTTNGPMKMKLLKKGDELLTRNGTFRPVEEVFSVDYKGQMCHITTTTQDRPLRVTPEHPIWTLSGIGSIYLGNQGTEAKEEEETADDIFERVIHHQFHPKFVEAGNLTLKDWVGVPQPQMDEKEEDDFGLSRDDCRMIGLIYRAGTFSSKTGEIVVKFNVDRDITPEDTFSFLEHYLHSRQIPFQHDRREIQGLTDRFIWTSHTTLEPLMMFDEDGQPRLHQRFMQLPGEHLKSLLHGIVEGFSYRIRETIQLGVFWFREVNMIRYICLRLGVPVIQLFSKSGFSLQFEKSEELNKDFPQWWNGTSDVDMQKDDTKHELKAFIAHGFIWSRVNYLAREEFEGQVMDLKIKNSDEKKRQVNTSPTREKDLDAEEFIENSYCVIDGLGSNGGGKRKGSIAGFLEPWHADIEAWLDLKKNHGKEEIRARDLFYGLWIPDLFMKRVESDGKWSLFCPNEAPGMEKVFGEEFEALYEKYEKENRARKVVPARELWRHILEIQSETGTPYMLYKDACNRKNNQKNLGTLNSSNLCCEILEYTSPTEIAVCTLASIALPKFLDAKTKQFNHDLLFDVVKTVTTNLNLTIDVQEYPVLKAKNSHLKHRPIGIGVQGLSDLFMMMQLPYDSDEARVLNRDIFETIYFAALTRSNELAQRDGSYCSFHGSPISQGIFQFDMWGVKPTSNRWDWDKLRQDILKTGLRNSLTTALMPTASTSQILGNNECFEPKSSNIYSRRTLAGTFSLVCKHLVRDLVAEGIWTKKSDMKEKIIANKGSIQNIDEIPDHLKKIHRTVWEIPGKTQLDMSFDRAPFVDQTQSLNIHMKDITFSKLSSMHFYGWRLGLKTGMYYLRSKAAADPSKVTIDPKLQQVADVSPSIPPTVVVLESKEESKHGRGRIAFHSRDNGVNNLDLDVMGGQLEIHDPETGNDFETEDLRQVLQWRNMRKKKEEALLCSLKNKEGCVSCSG